MSNDNQQPSDMTKVTSRSAFTAFEDGSTSQEPTPCFYDALRDDFVIFLPAYMRDICSATSVREATPAKAYQHYEVHGENYSRTVLFAKAGKRALAVPLRALPSEAAFKTFGIQAQVALGMTPVAVLEQDDDNRLVTIDEQGHLGAPFNTDRPMVLIDDTPENRTKIQQLIDSIHEAASQLQEMAAATDPAQYLAAIHWGAEPASEVAAKQETPPEDDDTL